MSETAVSRVAGPGAIKALLRPRHWFWQSLFDWVRAGDDTKRHDDSGVSRPPPHRVRWKGAECRLLSGGFFGEAAVVSGEKPWREVINSVGIGDAGQAKFDADASWKVSQSRSIRPSAWGERAWMRSIPKSEAARAN